MTVWPFMLCIYWSDIYAQLVMSIVNIIKKYCSAIKKVTKFTFAPKTRKHRSGAEKGNPLKSSVNYGGGNAVIHMPSIYWIPKQNKPDPRLHLQISSIWLLLLKMFWLIPCMLIRHFCVVYIMLSFVRSRQIFKGKTCNKSPKAALNLVYSLGLWHSKYHKIT